VIDSKSFGLESAGMFNDQFDSGAAAAGNFRIRPLAHLLSSWALHLPDGQPKHRTDEKCLANKIESDGHRQNIFFGTEIGSAENPQSTEQTKCE
jgi:hypothetical protein